MPIRPNISSLRMIWLLYQPALATYTTLVVYLVCKLGFFGTRFTRVLKGRECQKKSNLHTNELNTFFFNEL
jgi:hypothetical protein